MNEMKCVWEAGANLGKGALWHPQEQALYWIDNFSSELHRYTLNGGKDSWTFPGSISSIVRAKAGGLLATFRHGVSHIDVVNSKATELIQLESGLPDNRFNDGCCDLQGNYWFGSMDTTFQVPSGAFYRLGEAGIAEKVAGMDGICITNGPTFSADGNWIYYTDTGEQKIFRASIEADGSLTGHRLYIQFGPEDGYPDGMCTDAEGGLWVCHWSMGRVTRFDENGEIDMTISVPVPNVSKCAFGGADMRTFFITSATSQLSDDDLEKYPLSGGLFAIDVGYKGFCFPEAVCAVEQIF